MHTTPSQGGIRKKELVITFLVIGILACLYRLALIF